MNESKITPLDKAFELNQPEAYTEISSDVDTFKSQLGYTQRPIDQKRGIRNTFLPNVKVGAELTIDTVDNGILSSNIFILGREGPLYWHWDTSVNAVLRTKKQGTFIITGQVAASNPNGGTLANVYDIICLVKRASDDTPLFTAYHAVTPNLIVCPINSVIELSAGDGIYIEVFNRYTENMTFVGRLSLTEIS